MPRRAAGTRVAVYLRVSTGGQSVESQRPTVQAWLDANGVDASSVRWFIDQASGETLDRPAMNELQNAIRSGQIRTVVVVRLDRLARSMREGIDLICSWIDQGVRLVSVTQNLDFSGVTGRMMAALLLGVAEMEMQLRRERQASGIAIARERGVYTGRRIGSTKLEPRRAKELIDRGLSVSEAARLLGVGRKTIYRYLESTQNT